MPAWTCRALSANWLYGAAAAFFWACMARGDAPHASVTPATPPGIEGARPPSLRLVVATFDEQGVSPGLGDIIADLITQSIDPSKVQLVERRQVRRVLDEQIFSASDLSQPGQAIQYGKLAESRYVLLGSVYRVDGNYYVSARVVDVETGIVSESARATASFRTVDEMLSSMPGLVRAMGLCSECPIGTLAARGNHAAGQGPDGASTVRDYIERVGDQSGGQVRIEIEGGDRRLAVGRHLRLSVSSPRAGYLSLFVIDASGAVSMLLPNSRAGPLQVLPHMPVSVPAGSDYSIRVAPPLGMTRVKAVITPAPLPLMGAPDAAGLLRRVGLHQPISPDAPSGSAPPQLDCIGAELEFLVTDPSLPAAPDPVGGVAPASDSAASGRSPDTATQPLSNARELLVAAVERARRDPLRLSPSDSRLLRWPLHSPFSGGIDIGRTSAIPDADSPVLIAVIDADFDPDDPTLTRAFRDMDPSLRESLRDEIRRNGQAQFRHGNRVASLIAGVAPWLPSVSPGAAIHPIRVTTTLDGPDYRIERGRAAELIQALEKAVAARCKIVNLSLSIPMEGTDLKTLSANPVWDKLEKDGVLVVCAAGNSGENLDLKPLFPACLDRSNILCVGAVGPDGRLAKWSQGGTCTGARSVDVLAPGSLIPVSDGGGSIGLASGTSYASAFATGVAARWLQLEPGLAPPEVIRRMTGSAARSPDTNGASRSGIIQDPVSAD